MNEAKFAVTELAVALYVAGIMTPVCLYLIVDIIKTQAQKGGER